MATTRTSSQHRRSLRGAALALFMGAGIALTPVAASADMGGPARGAGTAQPVAAAPQAAQSRAAQIAMDFALAQRGKPYAWGGSGPNSYDCSGLTWTAYRAAGVNLPRTSRAQSTVGTPVSKANLRPGDLIFFYNPVGHVGMYIGNGQMVHSSTYGKPIAVVRVNAMPGYNSARRVA